MIAAPVGKASPRPWRGLRLVDLVAAPGPCRELTALLCATGLLL